jgi:hypothetical protein
MNSWSSAGPPGLSHAAESARQYVDRRHDGQTANSGVRTQSSLKVTTNKSRSGPNYTGTLRDRDGRTERD